ncbi:MAG: hypothetical protein K0R43_398 [Pseudoduganella sp.]|nr:hypothetical protein [Pseudoduganella sp.]
MYLTLVAALAGGLAPIPAAPAAPPATDPAAPSAPLRYQPLTLAPAPAPDAPPVQLWRAANASVAPPAPGADHAAR